MTNKLKLGLCLVSLLGTGFLTGAQTTNQNGEMFQTTINGRFGHGPGVNQTGTNNTGYGQNNVQAGSSTVVIGSGSTDGALANVDVFGTGAGPSLTQPAVAVANATYLGAPGRPIVCGGGIVSGAGTNLVTVAQGSTQYVNTNSVGGTFYTYSTNGVMTVYAGLPGTNSIIVSGYSYVSTLNVIESFALPSGYSIQGTNISGKFVPGP